MAKPACLIPDLEDALLLVEKHSAAFRAGYRGLLYLPGHLGLQYGVAIEFFRLVIFVCKVGILDKEIINE